MVASLLAAPAVLAQEEPASTVPVAVPVPERVFDGYDWASRVNHTHLLRDALAFASTVDLKDVPTPWIDLELSGLMPYRKYHLVGAGLEASPGYADAGGNAIFWSLPAQPGTWAVTDGVSGEPVTSIVVFASSLSVTAGSAYKTCHWYCPTRARPPQPTHTDDLEQGLVIEQAAYSFTPYASISVENCWTHRVTVMAKATAGVAGNGATAGGDRSYTRTTCETFGTAGTPTEFRRYSDFRKDTYDDSSYKIYAIRDTERTATVPRDVYFSPPSDANEKIVGNVTGDHPSIWVEEENAGGIRYGVGVEAYGTGLSVEFHATGGSKTRIGITFQPPTEGTRLFKYKFYNGDQETTGIVAAVWLEAPDCSPGCPP